MGMINTTPSTKTFHAIVNTTRQEWFPMISNCLSSDDGYSLALRLNAIEQNSSYLLSVTIFDVTLTPLTPLWFRAAGMDGSFPAMLTHPRSYKFNTHLLVYNNSWYVFSWPLLTAILIMARERIGGDTQRRQQRWIPKKFREIDCGMTIKAQISSILLLRGERALKNKIKEGMGAGELRRRVITSLSLLLECLRTSHSPNVRGKFNSRCENCPWDLCTSSLSYRLK